VLNPFSSKHVSSEVEKFTQQLYLRGSTGLRFVHGVPSIEQKDKLAQKMHPEEVYMQY